MSLEITTHTTPVALLDTSYHQGVLHALWYPNQELRGLHLWIESYERSIPLEKTESHHPYGLDHERLSASLKELLPFKPTKESLKEIQIEIPTTLVSHQPVVSFDTKGTASAEEMVQAAWTIQTIVIPEHQVLQFLAALSPEEVPYTFGASLNYWRKIGAFTLELLKKGSFVPTISRTPEKKFPLGRWVPTLTEAYATTLKNLCAGMPKLCNSILAPYRLAPLAFLKTFIDELLNAFIKSYSQELSLIQEEDIRDFYDEAESTLLTQLRSYPENSEVEHKKLYNLEHTARTWFNPEKSSVEKAVEPLGRTLGKPLSLLLKLEQPQKNQEGWQLAFFLQAVDDPSLILSAEQIWDYTSLPQGAIASYEDPQKRLLRELIDISDIFPDITRSLDEQFPTSLSLTTQEVHSFLRYEAKLLLQNSIALQLPPWWNKAPRKLQSHIHIKRSNSSGLISSDSLLEYDWKLSLGEHSLTEQEFKDLAALKEPLVQIRGEWVTVDSKELASALSFLQKKKKEPLSLMDGLRLALTKEDVTTGTVVESVSTEHWFEEILKRLQNPQTIDTLVAPSSFQGQLRAYQERGLTWLSYLKNNSFGACLADDMGLGKTIQIIALLLDEKKNAQTPTAPHLLICPLSVLGNWQQELARFAPSLTFMVHHGTGRLGEKEFLKQIASYDIVITTYALCVRDAEELLSYEWQSVILDEAQNIKNSESKQTRSIKQIRSRYRIALTGTPIENRLGELWSLMDFLNRGYLGSEEGFHRQFALPIERHKDEERATALKNLVQPFILRRVKTDKSIIDDLPDKIETKELCYLTKEQASLYQSVLDAMLKAIDQSEGIERRGLILATLMKLKQVCNHPAQFLKDNSVLHNRSGKLVRLNELLEEILSKKEKSLIFTQFSTMGELLKNYLEAYYPHEGVLFLHGGTPQKRRDTMIKQFQHPQGPSLFILSLKAGGTGLNLTEANHVIHFDRWWNPAVEDQATDRAFRIGQKSVVHVHKFISKGTLEERIDMLIEQKKQLATSIIAAGEHWITELSTDELSTLFSLTV